MLWWIGALLCWLVSAAWIIAIMADVFRRKVSAFGPKVMPWYAFHGVTALLTLWLVSKALGV